MGHLVAVRSRALYTSSTHPDAGVVASVARDEFIVEGCADRPGDGWFVEHCCVGRDCSRLEVPVLLMWLPQLDPVVGLRIDTKSEVCGGTIDCQE